MKKMIISTAVLVLTGIANADIVAGWYDFEQVAGATQAPQITTTGVSATAVADTTITPTANWGSTDETFGTVAGADGTSNGSENSYINTKGWNNGTTYVLTNNSGNDLSLAGFSFDYKVRSIEGVSVVTGYELVYISGNLGISEQTTVATANFVNGFDDVWQDIDLDLSTMADATLADGESATFTLQLSGASTADTYPGLDNVAFIGTIPEPATFGLVGMSAVAMLVFRRNQRKK